MLHSSMIVWLFECKSQCLDDVLMDVSMCRKRMHIYRHQPFVIAACFSIGPSRPTDLDGVYPVSSKRQKDQHSPGDRC